MKILRLIGCNFLVCVLCILILYVFGAILIHIGLRWKLVFLTFFLGGKWSFAFLKWVFRSPGNILRSFDNENCDKLVDTGFVLGTVCVLTNSLGLLAQNELLFTELFKGSLLMHLLPLLSFPISLTGIEIIFFCFRRTSSALCVWALFTNIVGIILFISFIIGCFL